jgi:ribosome biogenesis protein Nip4
MKKILDYYGVKMDLSDYKLMKIEKELYIVKKDMVPFLKGEVKAAGLKVKDSEISLEFAFKIARYATKNKVIINEKAETLFLYGRDIFRNNIIRGDLKKGKKLTLNSKSECLGIGFWDGKILKNVKDRGMFLRVLD